MAGKNVLVTGGCGRLGRLLVARLRPRHHVTVLDTRQGSVEGVKYLAAPIMEVTDIGDIDVIYHLAASIDYRSTREEMWERNVLPTIHLLDLAPPDAHFIFMSTTSVYPDLSVPITERTPPDPQNNYGWSKLEAERAIEKSGVPYTILRSSQIYGPDFEEGYLQVLKRLQEGKMKIIGDGRNYIPLVHQRDIVSALLLVKRNPRAAREVFNVDGDYKKTQEEFMAIASKVLGVAPPTAHLNPTIAKLLAKITGRGAEFSEYLDKLTRNRIISIGKIRKIGFSPKVSLVDGIQEVVSLFRERGLLS